MGAGYGNAPESVMKLDFGKLFANMFEALLSGNIDFLYDTAGPVFWPMLIGSLPTVLVVWIVFYFPLKALVEGYQKNRSRLRNRKGTA